MQQENAARQRWANTRAPWSRCGRPTVRPAPCAASPRLMDVLLCLAAALGDVVTREALLADAWLRRMVNDECCRGPARGAREDMRARALHRDIAQRWASRWSRLVAGARPRRLSAGGCRIHLASCAYRALRAVAAIVPTPPRAALPALTRGSAPATALTRLRGRCPSASDGTGARAALSPDGSRVAFASHRGPPPRASWFATSPARAASSSATRPYANPPYSGGSSLTASACVVSPRRRRYRARSSRTTCAPARRRCLADARAGRCRASIFAGRPPSRSLAVRDQFPPALLREIASAAKGAADRASTDR